MLLPCEVAIKYFMPAIRASVAKELSKNNLNQFEIASKLGVTQASVSLYLTGKYSKKIMGLEREKSIKEITKSIVSSITKNRKVYFQLSKDLCRHCYHCYNFTKISCEMKR